MNLKYGTIEAQKPGRGHWMPLQPSAADPGNIPSHDVWLTRRWMPLPPLDRDGIPKQTPPRATWHPTWTSATSRVTGCGGDEGHWPDKWRGKVTQAGLSTAKMRTKSGRWKTFSDIRWDLSILGRATLLEAYFARILSQDCIGGRLAGEYLKIGTHFESGRDRIYFLQVWVDGITCASHLSHDRAAKLVCAQATQSCQICSRGPLRGRERAKLSNLYLKAARKSPF